MSSNTPPKQRALVIGFIILGMLFTVFFGMRAFHSYKKFNGHRPPPHGKVETDVELIRDWMTISFISETYRVPERIFYAALQIPPLGNHDKSLKDLNREYYADTNGFVLETVKTTILAHQPPSPIDDSAATTIPPPTALPSVTP